MENGITDTHTLLFSVALGVIASVVPFNFPVMVPMWTLPIAIAMGKSFLSTRLNCTLKDMPMAMIHSSKIYSILLVR
jgi:hypothetical protein